MAPGLAHSTFDLSLTGSCVLLWCQQVLRLSETFGMDCALIVLNPRADQVIHCLPHTPHTTHLDQTKTGVYINPSACMPLPSSHWPSCFFLAASRLQTAALDKKDQASYLEQFTTVFHLTPCSVAEVPTTDNMLLYRAYPEDWVVAQKPAVGAPKVGLTCI